MQWGYFRLCHLLYSRLLAASKLPLSSFAPRPLRLFNQFLPRKRRRLALPGAPQFFNLSLQAFQLLLQFLDQRQGLCQLYLQLSNALIFWVRESFVVLFSHHRKCTLPITFIQESFGLFSLVI
jgi:hypothetical protein